MWASAKWKSPSIGMFLRASHLACFLMRHKCTKKVDAGGILARRQLTWEMRRNWFVLEAVMKMKAMEQLAMCSLFFVKCELLMDVVESLGMC